MSEPGAPAPGGHARADRAGRLGASGLSGPRPAAQPAAAPRPGGDGRARPDRSDHRPGPPRRPFRLPAHHGPAAGRGLAGAPQAGGAAVASGGAARAPHSPAAAATLGHRRLLHAAPSGAAEPRRVRRLRPRADAGRPGPAPADQRGRVPAGVPQHRRRPAPALRRRPRPADGALRAARPAGLPPLRHRPGVHRASGALLAAAARRDHALHRTGQSLGERVWGILHRHAPRRGSQPGDLHHPDRGPDPHRALAPRVQPGPAPQRPRLPPARPRRAGDPTSPPRPLGRQGLVHGPSMDALLGPAVKRRQRPGAPAALRHAVLGDAESAALQAPARAAHDSGLRARRREFWGAALRFGTPV